MKNSKNSILIVSNVSKGGMLHYVRNLIRGFDENDIDSQYLIPTQVQSGLPLKGRIRNISCKNPIYDFLNISNYLKLIKAIQVNSFTHVLLPNTSPFMITASLICITLKLKVLFVLHDPSLHTGENKGIRSSIIYLLQKIISKLAFKIIVHGSKLKRETINNYNTHGEKIITIKHPALNLNNNGIQKINVENKNNLLFFGRIIKYKGLDNILNVVSMLAKENININLTIAGAGDLSPYSNLINETKKNLKIINRFIHDDELTAIFNQCSCTVLPYKDASASGVIPLSYSFGRPVIATNVGELSEYIVNHKTGFIVNKDNIIAELYSTIKYFVSNEISDLHLMQEEINIYNKTELSWQKQINIIINNIK